MQSLTNYYKAGLSAVLTALYLQKRRPLLPLFSFSEPAPLKKLLTSPPAGCVKSRISKNCLLAAVFSLLHDGLHCQRRGTRFFAITLSPALI
jgi:hypothetical protein